MKITNTLQVTNPMDNPHEKVVIEHCAEPKCPECNQAAYKKGFEAGMAHEAHDCYKHSEQARKEGFEEGRMEAARIIGMNAALAGISIVNLDSEEEWREAVRQIKSN